MQFALPSVSSNIFASFLKREELKRKYHEITPASMAISYRSGVQKQNCAFEAVRLEDEIDTLTTDLDRFTLDSNIPMYGLQMYSILNRHRKEQRDEEIESKRLRTRLELSTDPLRDSRQTSGDSRLKLMRHLLNCLGYVRSSDQQAFHEYFIRACLPLIYGKDFQANHSRILKEHNISKVDFGVLIVTARRFGKTTAVAMFVCVLLLCVPGITIAIFSTCKRTSTSLTELVRRFLKFIPGAQQRIVEQNQERLYIAAVPLPDGQGPQSQTAKDLQASPDTSKLFSFPGEAKRKYITHTVRGWSTHMIVSCWIFESAHCCVQVPLTTSSLLPFLLLFRLLLLSHSLTVFHLLSTSLLFLSFPFSSSSSSCPPLPPLPPLPRLPIPTCPVQEM